MLQAMKNFGSNTALPFLQARGEQAGRIAGAGVQLARENPWPTAIGGTALVGLGGLAAWKMMGDSEWNPGNMNDPVQRRVVENQQRRGVGYDPAPAPPEPRGQQGYQRIPSQVEIPVTEVAKERLRLLKDKQKAEYEYAFADKYQQALGYNSREGF